MPPKDAFAFTVGKKKTPFQKHKEIEEDKKRRADAENAKLYQEFVSSFGDEDKDNEKAFVRGGVIQPGAPSQSAPAAAATAAAASLSASIAGAKKPGGKYVPSFLPPSMADALSGADGSTAASRSGPPPSRPGELSHGLPSPAPSIVGTQQQGGGSSSRGKPRSIDVMLEKLKRDQQEREDRRKERLERGSNFDIMPEEGGSFDDSDPWTTNLYVGNLAPDVDEEILKHEFLRFGNIASVKVMWPRDDDQRRRGRNCGFVAFMTREDAQRAKEELNNVMLHENELKIGWGKGVPIPSAPLYTSTDPSVGSAPPSRPTVGASVPPPGLAGLPEAMPWAQQSVVAGPEALNVGPDIVITAPSDSRVRYVADALASYVCHDGPAFEQTVVAAQAENPDFRFLYEVGSPEHAYYRWRLFSLASGDSMRSWRVEPFTLVEGGPRWVPPLMTSSTEQSHQTAAQRGGSQREMDKPLSDSQRDRFEDLLRGLSMERADVRAGMVFALDNADSAGEVVEILTDALTLPETPVGLKVARLLLLSDLLHNTSASVRNASRYRGLLEGSLPHIFESLQEAYRGLGGRMVQEAMRRHVLRVLRVWRMWSVFSDDFLNGLQATFLRPVAAAEQEPIKQEAPTALTAELDGLTDEEIETRCRRNGLSRKDGRTAMVTRLVALEHYLHGDTRAEAASTGSSAFPTVGTSSAAIKAEPAWQADTPGMFARNPPAAAAPAIKQEARSAAAVKLERPPEPVSKWTLADYDQEDADGKLKAEDSDNIFSEAGSTPKADAGSAEATSVPSPPQTSKPEKRTQLSVAKPVAAAAAVKVEERDEALEEERRQKLRQVEVAVLMLKEELEEKGLERAEVDARVAAQREKLTAEADAALAKSAPSPAHRSSRSKADKGSKGAADTGRRSSLGVSSSQAHDSARHRHSSPHRPSEDRVGDLTARRGSAHEAAADASGSRKRHRGSRSRSRSADRERRRERSRSRERERRREPSRERRRSRSRSRSRGRSTHDVGSSEQDRSRRHADEARSHRDRDTERRSARGEDHRGTRRDREDSRERGSERDRHRHSEAERDRHDRQPDRQRESRSSRKGSEDAPSKHSTRVTDRRHSPQRAASHRRSRSRSGSRHRDSSRKGSAHRGRSKSGTPDRTQKDAKKAAKRRRN